MITTTTPTTDRSQRHMQLVAGAIALTVVVKFAALGLEYGWQWEQAPWGLLLVFCLPVVLVAALLGRAPRTGVALLVLFSVGLLAFIGIGVAGSEDFPRISWGDWVLVAGGGAAAVLALVLAARWVLARGR